MEILVDIFDLSRANSVGTIRCEPTQSKIQKILNRSRTFLIMLRVYGTL